MDGYFWNFAGMSGMA